MLLLLTLLMYDKFGDAWDNLIESSLIYVFSKIHIIKLMFQAKITFSKELNDTKLWIEQVNNYPASA